ncbi:MAG: translation initiation factor IF-2 [Candidatus Omnitrophota bacterium]
MSVTVKKLSEDLGVSSDVILEQLRKMYVDVEDESSSIDDKIVGLVRIKLGIPEKVKKKPAKKKKKLSEAKPDEKKLPKKKEKEEEKTEDVPAPPDITDEKPETKVKAKKRSGLTVVGKVEELAETKKPEVSGTETKDAAGSDLSVEEKEKETSKKKKAEVLSDLEVVEKGERKKVFVKKPRKEEKRPIIEIIEKETAEVTIFRKRPGKSYRGKSRMVQETRSQAPRKTDQKLKVQLPVTLRNLAQRMNMKPSDLIKYFVGKGVFVNMNQDLDEDMAREVMSHFGYILELHDTIESIEKDLLSEPQEECKGKLEARAPVVTFMGHVDHGKTSLLDYIRKTMVTQSEKGGITQHIGAYKVDTPKGSVTFLDTPGHAAFTAMRARGANSTDVVVLVVAADDGVMPQTKEAIDHAKAAEVPIVVAINKCDLPGANPDKVRKGLQAEGLMPEAWGGDTVMVEVSAHTGDGVDELVEMLSLESEMLELKANPEIRARGVVIESKKTGAQGVVATLLVQNGTLKPGDVVLCGASYGRIKAMINDRGEKIHKALPSTPVGVLGLTEVPEAGEEFFVVKDEKKAKTLSLLKIDENRKRKMSTGRRVTLDDLHDRITEGSIKDLKLILKADVQGSVEALKSSLEELSTEDVKLNIVHSTVGKINESDIMLAVVTNAIIIGFHVKVDSAAEELAKQEEVDIRLYDIIYEAVADVKAAMEGLLEPEETEVFQGIAQVRQIFVATKIGKVAGCAVTKGTIHRKDRLRVKRDQEVVFEGEVNALKRFKDDVKEVKEGFECGITVKNFNDVRAGDIIEAYSIVKVARRLESRK